MRKAKAELRESQVTSERLQPKLEKLEADVLKRVAEAEKHGARVDTIR